MISSKSLEQIITDLRLVIDQIGSSFKNASDLILELARMLDESGQCERTRISRKIKELLADKIKERKITAKWIHDVLPSEYKEETKKTVMDVEGIHPEGRNLEKIPSPLFSTTGYNSITNTENVLKPDLECSSCKELYSENLELKAALTKSN